MNTWTESFEARKICIFQHFSAYEQLKFYTQMSWAWQKFNNLDVWPGLHKAYNLHYNNICFSNVLEVLNP